MDLEDLIKVNNQDIKANEIEKITNIIYELNEYKIENKKEFKQILDKLGRKNKLIPSKMKILTIYRLMASKNEIIYRDEIVTFLRKKIVRSLSGVVVITVFTSPFPETSKGVQNFSCEYDCHYCPKEPDQPRSYLLNEPGVKRANNNNFISTEQFWDRAKTYILMGHPLDKIELIISGGTFSSYPREYITTFIRDLFYAANVGYEKICGKEIRENNKTIEEEQLINQNESLIKIIGITIETRPDRINSKEILYLRFLGITRVQIGVQHIDDRVLNRINRKCKNKHTIQAIKLLKECGFKVDIHLMPDLPAPLDLKPDEMIELDREMFNTILEKQEYQADQWKIYPCETVPWTEIEKWYKEGIYKPYSENSNKLIELLLEVKQKIKPWIRLNRIIRDIPTTYILGGNMNVSMRNDLSNIMLKNNLTCRCIRCREIKNQEINLTDFNIIVRDYIASDGIEYFISWENSSETLLGFLRLRFNDPKKKNAEHEIFPELNNCSLIRELHIYGQVINHTHDNIGSGVQHLGLGKALINKAIEISKENNINKIAVISGVGVRNYYIKQGFEPSGYIGNYLIKNI